MDVVRCKPAQVLLEWVQVFLKDLPPVWRVMVTRALAAVC